MRKTVGNPSFVPFEQLESRVLFSEGVAHYVPPTAAPAPMVKSFLGNLPKTPTLNTTTIPANGDVNPYGVAIVPNGFAKGGTISPGDVLVSNFNDRAGLQGTGTTIVSISESGHQTTFFQGAKGLGLTTALGVLRDGFVLVGNVPAPDGMNVTPPGSLLVLDKNGHPVTTLSDPNLLDGPWDLAVQDHGRSANIFVSNVLTGTVTRVTLATNPRTDTARVLSETQIASGYLFRTDSAALVVGPTGLALAPNGTLYVASTGDNEIFAIPNAVNRHTSVDQGRLVVQDQAHLRGPLALILVGNHLITANGDAVNTDTTGAQNSELVEYTEGGRFLDEFQVDPTIGGAFGMAYTRVHGKTIFAAVDDVTNSLDEWILK